MILVWILELEKIRYKKLGKPDYGLYDILRYCMNVENCDITVR